MNHSGPGGLTRATTPTRHPLRITVRNRDLILNRVLVCKIFRNVFEAIRTGLVERRDRKFRAGDARNEL